MGMVTALRGWAYAAVPEAAGRRDLRLDLLRGWCVVVMIVDHVGGESSWLYALTGGNRFFVSAAEGFVLISGVTMGAVYAQVIAREGIAGMAAKVLRRVRTLYALTVVLTITFAGLSAMLGSPWTREATPGRPAEFFLGVLTLRRSYSLTDVLLLYTMLVLAAAPVLAALAHRRAALALGLSWTLWLLWQLRQAEVELPWTIVDGGFPFMAWQAIFVTGIVVGYHRDAIAARLSAGRRRALLVAAGGTTVVLVALFAGGLVVPPSLFSAGTLGPLGDALFDKDDASVGRVLALLAIGPFAYAVSTVAWVPLRRFTGWLLLPFGQRALVAYGAHIFVVALAATPLAEPLRRDGEHAWAQLAGVALVWAALPVIVSAGDLLRALGRSRPLAVPLLAQSPSRSTVPGQALSGQRPGR